MDSYKKHQIKEKIKKKKVFFIGTGLFLIAGIVAWCIGMYLSGSNPIEALISPFAITIYILIGIALIIFIILLFSVFMDKEGRK